MVPSLHANTDSPHFVCLDPEKMATLTIQNTNIVRKLVEPALLNGFVRHPSLHWSPSPWAFNEANRHLWSITLPLKIQHIEYTFKWSYRILPYKKQTAENIFSIAWFCGLQRCQRVFHHDILHPSDLYTCSMGLTAHPKDLPSPVQQSLCSPWWTSPVWSL